MYNLLWNALLCCAAFTTHSIEISNTKAYTPDDESLTSSLRSVEGAGKRKRRVEKVREARKMGEMNYTHRNIVDVNWSGHAQSDVLAMPVNETAYK